jgi:hypothetical protein
MTRTTKPLFRAMKTKPDRGAALPIHLPDQSPPESGRRALDFYPTGQPDAVRALLARDGQRLKSLGSVWEPAAGRGDLCREIAASGLSCVASDVADHGCPGVIVRSFYDFVQSPAPAIITNPPYNEINARDGHGRWLRHTLAIPGWQYLALLLSWDWPAARQSGLGALLDAHPFSYSYLMRWKLDFTGEGSPPQRNAWFVWDRMDLRATDGSAPEPSWRFMDREDGRQSAFQLE